jgi:hypothetical protein
VCTGGHVHIDGCKYYSFTVYECISIENVPSCLGSFDPSSPLTAYVDHEACGVRGDDANADFSGCQYDATLVCSQALGSWDGYFVDGCEYYAFDVYECNGAPTSLPTENPTAPPTPQPTTTPSSSQPTIPYTSFSIDFAIGTPKSETIDELCFYWVSKNSSLKELFNCTVVSFLCVLARQQCGT